MATIDLGKIKQVFRGTYNNATAYVPDDLVVFTDTGITSTYICTTATTGNNPSSGGTAHANWAYIAKGVADPIPSQSGQSGKFLKTNGSTLSFDTVAVGPELTEMDSWRIHSNFNNSGTNDVTSNWERADTFFDKTGTGLTESSGVFTFPQTGKYWLVTTWNSVMSSGQYQGFDIQVSTDGGSSFNQVGENYDSTGGSSHYSSISATCVIDVTNASNFRFKFRFVSSTGCTVEGNTNNQRSGFVLLRLGDT